MAMQFSDEVVKDAKRRLHRVAGQISGIEKMIDEGRECRDVVTQISAATKALEQAGFRLVAAGLTFCVEHPEEAAADGYELKSVQKMFMGLA
ncbi:MAG: metal-sensitive transcriptional regulator [Acidimicrobiales bacterium]